MPTLSQDDQVRYGIAEVFGRPIDRLDKGERDTLLEQALRSPVREYPSARFACRLKPVSHAVPSGMEYARSAVTETMLGAHGGYRLDPKSLQREPLSWCAVELQAVYFSGPNMAQELAHVLQHRSDSMPFPGRIRRPDYRSSAPKRLMPQLQIKVPTLRRWGKKMAVVVDRHFYQWMGEMERERTPPNDTRESR